MCQAHWCGTSMTGLIWPEYRKAIAVEPNNLGLTNETEAALRNAYRLT
jgi:hypothetical protein